MDLSGNSLRLLKRGQSGIRLLFGRMGIAILLLVAKILLMVAFFVRFEDYIVHYYGGSAVITLLMVLHLINKPMEPSIRTTWIILVMAAPIFGSLMYFFIRSDLGHRLLNRMTFRSIADSANECPQDEAVLMRLQNEDPGAAGMCNYAIRYGDARLFCDTHTEYLPSGEEKLNRLLVELEKAQNYIYLEYFIVREGKMWGSILEVLARKAKQGVDVRLMYDGTCEFIMLPRDYPKKLAKLGIKCKVFAPFKPIVSTHYNYRDHRKIIVIDGKVAFNGGVNLSDEYINVDCPYGHWKDVAVLLKGAAVQSYTRMFLQMWNMSEKISDYSPFGIAEEMQADGFVMSFADNPMDEVQLAYRIYKDMIDRTCETVDIMTPYLILDSEMENSLRYAAERGVRVRLLLPHISDNYVANAIAKTHYHILLNSGVQIYEYTPGFVHGKVLVKDGQEAVVGTVNFDYRSFYHHYECGTYLYRTSTITEICKDYQKTIDLSQRVDEATMRKEKWHVKLVGYCLKGFSPLL